MIALLRGLFVLPMAALAWVGALWYGVAPNFAGWSWPSLLGVHILPPLAIAGAVWGYLRHRRNRAQAAAAEREQAAVAEASAAREAARQQHDAELVRLRFACDCRGLAMAQISRDEYVAEGFGLEDVALSEMPPEAEKEELDILEHLRPAIREALEGIYAAVAAAARLPIYLVPPAEAAGEELFTLIREEHRELSAALELPAEEAPPLYFLSTGDSIANCILNLFSNTLELPGAVVLGFDSPWLRAVDDDEEETPQNEITKWLGKPGQGVFALLLTNARLPEMVAALHQTLPADEDADAMTPYWERQLALGGEHALLQSMRLNEREELVTAPLLGRIHRAHAATLGGLKSRDAVAALLPPLEKSRISAGLLAAPFVHGDETPEAKGEAPECGWLVHNAGGVDCSGQRLATLGMALYQQGVEVDPIHAGSNLVAQAGDLGQARSLGLLAMAVARAAANQAAALVAEFNGDEHIAFYFVVATESQA